jgi:broad specificity phosphatase PhoE
MRPHRIVLVRHANSEANADKSVRERITDHLISLTEEGHKQAFEKGKELLALFGSEPIKVYRSHYRRVEQTWDGIRTGAGGKLNVVDEYVDPRLREQDFGHLRSMEAFALIDAERSAYGTYHFRIPDGESGADVDDRISIFLDTLHRDFEKPDYPDNALIVSHGLTIRLFLRRWFKWPVEQFERLRNPFNCQHFLLERQGRGGKYELKTPLRTYTEEETDVWKKSGEQNRPWMR